MISRQADTCYNFEIMAKRVQTWYRLIPINWSMHDDDNDDDDVISFEYLYVDYYSIELTLASNLRTYQHRRTHNRELAFEPFDCDYIVDNFLVYNHRDRR